VELDLHPLPAPCTLDPTALHDQGYGSERSPEEEQPPSLPGMLELTSKYPFITQGKEVSTPLVAALPEHRQTNHYMHLPCEHTKANADFSFSKCCASFRLKERNAYLRLGC
jgi:hypothetical protein